MKVLQFNIGDIREWDSVGGNDFILHIQIVKILQLISPLEFIMKSVTSLRV